MAAACQRAWTPAPNTVSTLASGRAKTSVASAETAAVRTEVTAAALRTAAGTPVAGSSISTSP